MALNVVVDLLSALIVLPPILVWAEETGGWVSGGLRRPIPEPIAFAGEGAAPLPPAGDVLLPEPVAGDVPG